jgi:hypothetical protein
MTFITTKFKSGGLYEKHVVALGNLGTTSAFAFRPRETNIILITLIYNSPFLAATCFDLSPTSGSSQPNDVKYI